jgi:hypothetical protein
MCSLCCRYSIFKEQLPLRSESRRQLFSLTHLATGCQTGLTCFVRVPPFSGRRRAGRCWAVSRRQKDDCAMEFRGPQLGAAAHMNAPFGVTLAAPPRARHASPLTFFVTRVTCCGRRRPTAATRRQALYQRHRQPAEVTARRLARRLHVGWQVATGWSRSG